MEGDWLTVPWLKIPKTLCDKIQDCKGKLPAIWQRAMTPCKRSSSGSYVFCPTCRETRRLIRDLQDQLDQWLLEFEMVYPQMVGLLAGRDKRSSQSRRPFVNQVESHMANAYWETRLVLYSLLWRTGKRPDEVCHDGIASDLERYDNIFVESTRAISRDAPYFVGPGVGAYYRDGLVSSIHAAGAFCERRGGLGQLGERVIYIQNHIMKRWDLDRLATPIILTDDGSDTFP
ncbi:hypothetical protein PWT90_06934 [Aphanocladium album]|nr:hypothetical protein PWT90_06934 [Aphanocladium album]